jgi:hypothetical protein
MSVRLAPHVTYAETEDGAVLLDESAGRYFQLNSTAALVLSMLVGGGDADDAVAELRARAPRGSEDAARDVATLLDSLRKAKLVRP